MKVSKRILAIVLAALSASAVFASGRADKPADPKAPVTIRVFHFMSEQSKRDGLDKMIAQFNAENPAVKVVVEATDFNTFSATLKTKIAAGDAPDVIFGRPKMFAELVTAGQLMDLTGQSFLGNVAASSLESMKVGGKVYGLPLDVQTMGVFYNKALFEANGWKVPSTYSELIGLCKAIQAKGIVPFAFGFKDAWTAQVVFQSEFSGGPLAKMPDFYGATMARTRKFGDYPQFLASLDRYAERLKYGNPDPFSVDYSRQLAMFATGQAAMVMQGNWAVGDIRKANPEGKFGYFLNPAFDVAADNYLDIAVDDAFMASAQTKNKDAVLKFLAVMASPEGAKAWAETAKVISVVKGVKVNAVDPMLLDIQAYLDGGKTFNFEGIPIYSGQYDKTFRQIQEEFAVDPTRNSAVYAKRLDAEFDKIKATE